MFVSIDQHAANIAYAISEPMHVEWFYIADWLSLAASIQSVAVDTFKHEPSSYLCEAAWEFEDAQSELREKFIGGLTVFTFVWAALEAAIKQANVPEAKRPDGKKAGKIWSMCAYLDSEFAGRDALSGLNLEVARFQSTAQQCRGMAKVETRATDPQASSRGLYMVYELRNQFAHGSADLPEPDEENRPISPHQQLVESATRIVLMHLQLILSLNLPNDLMFCEISINGSDDGEVVPFHTLLLACHLSEGWRKFWNEH